MGSMKQAGRGRQVRPDLERGVVVAIDLAKDSFEYGCFRRDLAARTRRGSQDEAGFVGLEAALRRLQEQGLEVWVGYEPTGPYGQCLLAWLGARGWKVVAVSPFHVARSKEVRDNSPAKSDQKDPQVIADLVWSGCYFQPRRLEGVYGELRVCAREWESLRGERTALRNEFQSELMVWFPELGRLFRDRLAKSVRAVVRGYPRAPEVSAGGLRRLRAVLRKGTQGRCVHRAEEILAAAARSVAPAAGQAARQARLLRLLARVELVEQQQGQLLQVMEQLLTETEEAPWLQSVPQMGTITVAGLLGECGRLRDFPRAEALEKFVGLNLYHQSSGQYRGAAHISKRGRSTARYLLCQAALRQTRRGGVYQAEAQAFREHGKKAGQIRVALARKLLGLLYALVRERRNYVVRSASGAEAEGGHVIPGGAPARKAA